MILEEKATKLDCVITLKYFQTCSPLKGNFHLFLDLCKIIEYDYCLQVDWDILTTSKVNLGGRRGYRAAY